MFCLSACCLVGREIFSNTIPNNSNTHIIILSAWWVGVDGTRVHKFPEVLNARGLSHLEHLEHLECSHQPHIQDREAKKHTQRAG